MEVILVVPAELLLGMALGFLIGDGRPGLSLAEVKVSSLVFLLSTGFVFLAEPHVPAVVIIELAANWVAINAGMLAGERIRIGMVRRILNPNAIKDVELAVSQLVQALRSYTATGGPDHVRDAAWRLAAVHRHLARVGRQAEAIHDAPTIQRVRAVGDLCQRYFEASVGCRAIHGGQACDSAATGWDAVGAALTDLAGDMLRQAEDCIKQRLTHVWGGQIVRMSMLGR